MKKLLFFFLSLSTVNFAFDDLSLKLPEEKMITPKNGYFYLSGGFAGVLPKASLGYRYQEKKHGGDISQTLAYFPNVWSTGLQYNYLYFPKPNPNSQMYLGAGLGAHLFSDPFNGKIGGAFSYAFVTGYQFRPKNVTQFVELKLGMNSLLLPIPSLSYGVSF